MIKHDQSDISVVTTCTKCGHWSAFSFTIEDARERGYGHLVDVHGLEPARAREAERQRKARHAARHAVR